MKKSIFTTNCRYQIVFLVDVSIGVQFVENEAKFECLLNKTRLGALKILTFLEDTLPVTHKSTNLKWGFKFFNFSTFNTNIERYEFKDFSIRTFEQFESLLENKSVVERTKVKDRAGDGSPVSINVLSSALKEVVTDYQWDFPDITSPVRPTRYRKVHISDEPNQHNYVFILGPCPQTVDHWNIRKVQSKDVENEVSPPKTAKVREAILPPMVSRIFCDQKKIKLFWVDTMDNPVTCDVQVSFVVLLFSVNLDSSDVWKYYTHTYNPALNLHFLQTSEHLGPRVVHKALIGLGGGLIPIHAILQVESAWNSRIENILTGEESVFQQSRSSDSAKNEKEVRRYN